MATMIRVLLVEDHPIAAGGIAGVLAAQPDMELAAVAGTVAEARRRLATPGAWDIVLLDLRLPDGSGIDILRDLEGTDDAPPSLVLSSFQTPEYVAASVALGAGGFLLKTATSDEIAAAIREVAGGGLAFTADQLRPSRSTAWEPLTEREHAVLSGILAGRSNDELAADLGLARKTVEAGLSRLFARYGVASRTELALTVDRGAVLDLPVRPTPRPGAPRR
ncbi:MAG: response regulator transcription factor [Chloroflexota bacterium]